MARDEAEPDSVVWRLAEAFLDMMPGCVFSLENLSAAASRIRTELNTTSTDAEFNQITTLSFTISEMMIGNCAHTGVPNADVRVLPVH